MPFIEDVAGGHVIIRASDGSIYHDKCMVCDNKAGGFCFANRMFDETFVVVIACGIDAFTATIG